MAAGTGEKRPTSAAPPIPSRIPTTPPLTVRATASSRNWRNTSRVRAPTALRSPISRVRSDTLTSMMFITPTPPTSREMPAIEASTRVRMPRMRPTTPRMSRWVRTWYSCSGWARATTSRMMRCSSSTSPVLGALTAIPSTRLTPNSRWAAVTGMNTSASRATPKAVPTRLITPTTRKRTPPTVTDLPTGSLSGNSASAGSAPSTATRRRVSTSAAVKNAPLESVRSNTSGMVSLVPLTLTLLRRAPTLAISPEAMVVATRRGSPTASPTRRTSSRPRRESAGVEPNDRLPGATNRMLEPSDSTPEVTSSRAPVPIATSRTTLATRMTTPSMVSPERSVLARHAAFFVQAGGQVQHLVAGARVQVAGGLVGEQHRRLGDQRAGDRHPLLLAAGELRGPVLQAVAEPDRLERGDRPPAALGAAEPAVDQRQADVADGRGPRQELEALEDEPDHLVAHQRQLVVGEAGHGPPLEPQRAAGRPVQPAEQPEQGRLPRPARPHDRQRVAGRDLEVNPVERPDFDPVQPVDLGDAPSLHHGMASGIGCRLGHGQAPGQSWPSRSRSAPRDTTRSPSRSPAAMATRSSPSAATCTWRRRTLPRSTTNTAWPPARPTRAEPATESLPTARRTSIAAVAVIPTRGTGRPGPPASPRTRSTW